MATIKRRGTSWQATVRGPDGRERTATFRTRVEGEGWAADQVSAMRRGDWIDRRVGRVALSQYARDWLTGRTDLRPTTRAKYGQLLERHILPVLGGSPLAGLSPSQVRSWYLKLAKQHPSTAAGAYRLLSTICKTAVADEVIGRSPCKVKGAGIEHAEERPVLSLAEVDAAVSATAPRYRLAVLLAAWCQLRRGEVLGLQRGDVDLLHGTISVERTWSMRADGRPVLGAPKTDASRRRISIPSNVISELTTHLAHVGADPEAWLFAGAGPQPVSPRTLDRAWTEARRTIGRADVRFHDLRHAGLTWSAATGATTAELMRRAGHKSAVAALRYQHATEDRDRVLADALAGLAASVADISRTRPDRQDGAAIE